jgi:hypothetical protein
VKAVPPLPAGKALTLTLTPWLVAGLWLAGVPFLPAAWAQPAREVSAAPASSSTGPGSEAQPLTARPLPPAATGRSNDMYRSVDENGTPTFTQVPPSGRTSKPVDLKPLSGSIDSVKPIVPQRPSGPAAPSPSPSPSPAPAADAVPERAAGNGGPAGARGLPFDTYRLIRRGMSEGELLGRAGPPDYRGNEVNRGLLQESWYYLPTATDPFTTIIQLRGGRVVDTERIRKL